MTAACRVAPRISTTTIAAPISRHQGGARTVAVHGLHDVVLHEGVAADHDVRAQIQTAEGRDEAFEILGAPQVEPGPDAGDHQAPARAVALRERPGDLEWHVRVGDRREGGGRHQVAGGRTLRVGHRRERLLRQQPPDIRQQHAPVVLIGRHQIVQRRDAREQAVTVGLRAIGRADALGDLAGAFTRRQRDHRPARDAAAERAIDALVPAPRLLHLRARSNAGS